MESGIRSIFLTAALATLAAPAWSQEQADEPPQVIEPQVERRDVDVAPIDTEDFELTAFVGIMGVEDFESNVVYGARFAYHVNEALFVEATYGMTELGTTTY